MTKAEIVSVIASNTGMTRLEADSVLKGFFETVIEAMKRGETVEIRGFGTFKVAKRAQRVARNPRTNDEVIVPQRVIPTFRPSKEFKDVVNNSTLL